MDSLTYFRPTTYIKYSDHSRSDTSPTISGRSATEKFAVDFGNIVQGGTFHLSLSATLRLDDGTIIQINPTATSRVKGSNPTKPVIKAELGTIELQVTAYKESRFRQFDSQGLPVFGVPKGFGIMQLDNPPPTARQIWDWKLNIAGGKNLRENTIKIVKQHYKNVKTAFPDAVDLTDAQFKAAVYQYYNSGNSYYWNWDDVTKQWVKGTFSYADDALRIESLVNSGQSAQVPEWD